MEILQTPNFARQIKKLHENQKLALDKALRAISKKPTIGEIKRGDLRGIRVYKFKIINQLTLLAYVIDESGSTLILLAYGSHENFYRDLKHLD